MKKKQPDQWHNNIGRIIKKENGGYFLVFERKKDKDKKYKGDSPFPITIEEGDYLHVELTKDSLEKAVKKKLLKKSVADKIAEREKFTISLPPVKDEESSDDGEESEDEEEEKPKKKKSKGSKKAKSEDEDEDQEESDEEDESDDSDESEDDESEDDEW